MYTHAHIRTYPHTHLAHSGYPYYAEAFEHQERTAQGRFPGQLQQARYEQRAAKEGWVEDIRLVMAHEEEDATAAAERKRQQIFARMLTMPPCLKCNTPYTLSLLDSRHVSPMPLQPSRLAVMILTQLPRHAETHSSASTVGGRHSTLATVTTGVMRRWRPLWLEA
jgi:hypothetical protein